MGKFSITSFNSNDHEFLDSLIKNSSNGTIYHERKFLSYHGEKFKGRTADLVVKNGDKISAIVSFLIDGDVLSSPYGASYGGFVFPEPVSYSHSVEILKIALKYVVEELGIKKITISPTPQFCSYSSSETFLFAMQEAGFTLTSRDVCSAVDLRLLKNANDAISNNAQNMIRKARKSGVEIMSECSLDNFWTLLSGTYKKHGVPPTHTYDELSELNKLYPDQIVFSAVAHDGVPIAAICEFSLNPVVMSSFYFGQDEEKKHLQGLSLAIEVAMDRAIQQGYHFYDFGTSTVGMNARPNVFRFKESFGANGYFRESYKWLK